MMIYMKKMVNSNRLREKEFKFQIVLCAVQINETKAKTGTSWKIQNGVEYYQSKFQT